MSDTAVAVIRAIVRDELRCHRTAEVGVVTAARPHESDGDRDNYECDVTLRDTGLELRRVPVATSRLGFVAAPAKDDLVLVHFLGGDAHRAVVTARLYSDEVRPPTSKVGEAVYVSPDRAEQGLRRLHVELPNGNTLTVDDDAVVLAMGGTKLTIKHDGDVSVECENEVKVKSRGNATVEAQGDLTLKAAGEAKLEGNRVTVKGSLSATVEGGTSTTVKGATLALNGQATFSPA